MKSTFIAIVFTSILLRTHPACASDLSAILQLTQGVSRGGVGVESGTNWVGYSSSAATLGNADGFSYVQGMTTANFGDLSIDLNLDESGDIYGDDGYDGYAGVQAAWSDTATISNATLNGTQGYLRPIIRYTGTVSGNCDSDADGSASVVYFYLVAPAAINESVFGQVLWAYPTNSPNTVNLNFDTAGLAAFAGVDNLDIPFIYGQPFDISFTVTLSTGSPSLGTYYIANHRGYLRLQWLGAQVLDANSDVVSNFTLASDSGTDWSVSQASGEVLQINGFNFLNGTNLVITGANGAPYNPVFLLGSTNLTLPMTNWIHLDTNTFDFVGNVNFTNAVTSPQYYFRLISQ
jgi:hypothetical protein